VFDPHDVVPAELNAQSWRLAMDAT